MTALSVFNYFEQFQLAKLIYTCRHLNVEIQALLYLLSFKEVQIGKVPLHFLRVPLPHLVCSGCPKL